jgi:hypothetical protein
MKNTIIILLLALSLQLSAQDTTPITVNIRDNAKLQFGGQAVKMKAVVLQFRTEQSKDFVLHLYIQMYANNAGAYGGKITDLITADGTLSAEEKSDLLERYRDREVIYTTAGKYVDSNGEHVASDAPGAQSELAYWQAFKLNNAALGMTSASTQGALDAIYKIQIAIITKLNSRKNF